MLALCWFYCIPFAKFLYFASAPILIVFALFMLKRGVSLARAGLRKWALALIFISLIKICAFDVRALGDDLLCTVNEQLSEVGCNRRVFQALQVFALIFLVASSFVLFQVNRMFANVKTSTQLKPDDVQLGFWSKLVLMSVCVMVVWQCAPWVGYLTVGKVPDIFMKVPWQWFAIGNLLLLLYGFWRAESCNWNYEVKHKQRMAHLNQTWTQRDTLWMCVFIYLVALALSYVAHDVLTHGGTRPMVN
ncbi:MAG: hypothetical protein H3C49_00575 [Alphaproteobacteria bacterium]|nr:hypothetical protein [Alphaproteobacteria bacterium]HRI76124.1 hypothetical protein [Alphaproteobacteria bacterium]